MANEILSQCGYRCDLCLAYKENIALNDKRQSLSDGWYKYFGFRIEPEKIICDGCLSDDCDTQKLIDNSCPVRPCVTEKSLENCSQCDDYICDKLRKRLVNIKTLENEHGEIPKLDRRLFIRAYENDERLSRLRSENAEYNRMYNKRLVPDEKTMAKFIGGKCSALWSELVEYIRNNYSAVEHIVYGGKPQGWSLKYKQSSSKTLFTFYPERKSFSALIVYGKKELERIESRKEEFSPATFDIVLTTKQFHDGKWIWYKVRNEDDIKDLLVLLHCKKEIEN